MSIIIPNPPGAPDAPVINLTALRAQRRLTRAFIMRLPVVLVLTPRTKDKKPAGGWAWLEGTPRDPQTMTLIEQTGLSGNPKPVVTQDGVERIVEFELLSEWDALLSAGDVFTYTGKDWEVIELWIDNGYEKRALVAAR
jgi:hypothetical protein